MAAYTVAEYFPIASFSVVVDASHMFVKQTSSGRVFIQVATLDTGIPAGTTGWTAGATNTDTVRTWYWEAGVQTFTVKDEMDNIYLEIDPLVI